MGNWGSIFLGMIVGFLMMPFLIHHFGDDRYGVWVLTLNFTGYLGLLNLGVGGSIVKYVAEYKAKNDQIALNEVCTSSFCLYLAAGILTAVLAFLIAVCGIGYFKIPVELLPEARCVVLIVGLQIASSLPFGTFSSYMRGIQRYDTIALISVLVLILRTAAIVWFVLEGYGLVGLAIIHFASIWVEGIIKIIYVYKVDKDFELSLRFIHKKSFKTVFDYSLFFFLYFVSIRLIFAVDSLLIGFFLGTAAVTFYAVAYRLAEYMRLLIMGTAVFQPAVSQLHALSQNDKNRLLMSLGTKYVMMICLPIGAALIIVGSQFLGLWIGDKYAVMSYPVLVILAIGMIGHLAQHIAVQILQGLARHRLSAYLALLQAVVTVGLIIMMMRSYDLMGAALGKTIPMIIFNFIWVPWHTCRLLKIPFRQFISGALVPPFLATLIYSMVLYALSKLIPIHTWVVFCVDISLALIVYVSLAFMWCFTREERTARFYQIRAAINFVG